MDVLVEEQMATDGATRGDELEAVGEEGGQEGRGRRKPPRTLTDIDLVDRLDNKLLAQVGKYFGMFWNLFF